MDTLEKLSFSIIEPEKWSPNSPVFKPLNCLLWDEVRILLEN